MILGKKELLVVLIILVICCIYFISEYFLNIKYKNQESEKILENFQGSVMTQKKLDTLQVNNINLIRIYLKSKIEACS